MGDLPTGERAAVDITAANIVAADITGADITAGDIGGLRAAYLSARPWPHVLLPELVPADLIAAAYVEEDARRHGVPGHASHRQAKAETATGFGPAATAILELLDSAPVVAMLAELTGIADLQSDPTHTWAGLHVNGPGAFHGLHRDFPRHPDTGLWHRGNVLVYLNPTWPPHWGGALELWEKGGRSPGRTLQPVAGNTVFFETHAATIHGLPDPIDCPPDQARLSLNAFYYSHQPPPGPRRVPLIRRPRRPQDPWQMGIATPIEVVAGLQDRTPELVRSAGRAVKAKIRTVRRPLT